MSAGRPVVLIVDPNETTRFVLCELLRRSGAQPVTTDAKSTAVRAAELSASAIYVDADAIGEASLHGMAHSLAGATPAIIVAGTNRPTTPHLQGVFFIRKPYHFRDLVHKIWTSVGEAGAPAQAAA